MISGNLEARGQITRRPFLTVAALTSDLRMLVVSTSSAPAALLRVLRAAHLEAPQQEAVLIAHLTHRPRRGSSRGPPGVVVHPPHQIRCCVYSRVPSEGTIVNDEDFSCHHRSGRDPL